MDAIDHDELERFVLGDGVTMSDLTRDQLDWLFAAHNGSVTPEEARQKIQEEREQLEAVDDILAYIDKHLPEPREVYLQLILYVLDKKAKAEYGDGILEPSLPEPPPKRPWWRFW